MMDPQLETSIGVAILVLLQTLNMYLRGKAEAQVKSQNERIAQVADNTHTLVNSQMGAQLKSNAVTARALAVAAPTDANIKNALEADQQLADHSRKQAVMDSTPSGKAYQPDS